jgi:hypothetical protein
MTMDKKSLTERTGFKVAVVAVAVLLLCIMLACVGYVIYQSNRAKVSEKATATAAALSQLHQVQTLTARPTITRAPTRTATPTPSLTFTITPSFTPSFTPTITITRPVTYAWSVPEVVDNAYKVGVFPAMVFDLQGQPNIIYLDNENEALKYAFKSLNRWDVKTLVDPRYSPTPGKTSPGRDGFFNSLAWKQDVLALSYYIENRQRIVYAYQEGITWKFNDSLKPVEAASTSLVIDSSGTPGIAYFDNLTGELTFAHLKPPNTWQKTVIDTTTKEGVKFPLVYDSQKGLYYICYFKEGKGLYFGEWDNKDKPNWTITPVDANPSIGYYPALALDGQGNPHISYYDQGNGRLMYASLDGSTWKTEVVDSQGDVGKYSAIAVNSQGTIFIAYYDASGKALKSAVQTSSGWDVTTVDANVGNYTLNLDGSLIALALDLQDVPHIAYYDAVSRTLKYASAAEK